VVWIVLFISGSPHLGHVFPDFFHVALLVEGKAKAVDFLNVELVFSVFNVPLNFEKFDYHLK
jgi:hypothetical protein